jgi:hypothetical protein
LDENEAAAIAGFEVHGELEGTDGSRKAVTVKFKFLNRIDALALIGKACHWYAGEQEQTGADSGSNQKTIVVNFVKPSMPPEESYRRMVGGPN